ncbi:Zinc transporter ZIP12 [Holothuria leucospilota]|uniref:Zinc transporter ZIP12 n=1 Tax=Holothuria leucospilota TaxID=206669 RepID=A0A9Q1CSS1_HOLLE|nr:Zinc transporter ZIP12 [Holothuria leucospilota]
MGVVCTYFGLFLALNSVLVLGPVNGQHSHDHGDHDHHHHGHGEGMVHDHIDPFLTVKTHVVSAGLSDVKAGNADAILSEGEIHEVVSTLLDRLNCPKNYGANVQGNCSACSSVLTKRICDVLQVNREDGLTERQFEDAAPILLNALTTSNFAFACDEGNALSTPGDYLTALASRQGTPDRVTKEEMTSLLESLSQTYTPATLGKCFDTDELFREVYDVSLGASLAEMSHLAPLIVAYLLEGYCIGPAQYPNPDSFLEDIIAMYGHDGVIPLVDFELILKKLKTGTAPGGHDGHDHSDHSGHDHGASGHGDHSGHDHGAGDHSDHSGHDHSGHDHRRKRRVAQIVSRENRQTHSHGHDHSHDHSVHDHSSHEHDMSNVTRVEEVAHTCFTAEELLHSHGFHPEDGLDADGFKEVCPAILQQQLSGACSHITEHSHTESKVSASAYLYGTLCVFVVSLCAIAGGLLIPLLKEEYKEMIISMLIAMAVSTLSGDALIHLIPLATGLHVHEVPHDHSGHDHGAHHHDHDFSYVWKTFVTLMSLYIFFLLEAFMSTFCQENGRLEKAQKPGSLEENLKLGIFKFGSLPIMILLSDGFHNFCDGLAMGASFAASLGTGLSTSVAVFCHELPHELGDLAILLKSGMKLKWALFLNFLSALTCFLGFFIGIAIGSTLVARQWILSVTAGMFLYVGLVDMMPQILNSKNTSRPVLTFALQNVGFLLGAFAILFISYLEESIFISV